MLQLPPYPAECIQPLINPEHPFRNRFPLMDKDKCIAEDSTLVMKNVMRASVMPSPEGYSSRLEYWEKHAGRRAGKCAHEICERPATEGAVATRAFSADHTRYIFPACETCGRRTEMLYIHGPLVVLPE